MPQKVWAVGEEVLAVDFNTYVQQQVVPTFPSLSALQSVWPDAPVGALAMTVDTLTQYMHVAAGGPGWVTRSPQTFAVGLTGTIPNSTSQIAAGTIAVAAVPFTRLLMVGGCMTVTTSATVPFQLSILDNVNSTATVARIGRATGGSNQAICLPYPVLVQPNVALTFTGNASFIAAPGTTGIISTDVRFSQLVVQAFPA